ncbi:hypothetical protein JCM19000A_02570 [Silvimonas sp. JCM 19000]
MKYDRVFHDSLSIVPDTEIQGLTIYAEYGFFLLMAGEIDEGGKYDVLTIDSPAVSRETIGVQIRL